MTSDERNALWSRNAKFLRVMSGLVGLFGGVWALVIVGLAVFSAEVGDPWSVVVGLVHAALVLTVALFVMALGRVVASIAEIHWFASNPVEE